MKKSFKILALVLALLMIIPAVIACGDSGDDDKTTPTDDQGAVVTTAPQGDTPGADDPAGSDTPGSTDDPYKSTLPAYDWQEETFDILGRDVAGMYSVAMSNFELSRDEMPGDVVGKAVWDRNQILKDKYNFIVSHVLSERVTSDAQTLYDSQDDVYDLVIYQTVNVFGHASSAYLLDLNTIMYLNFDHPTWNKDINKELTIGGKLYATTNKFLLQDKARVYTMFYNRELAREAGLGYLEDHVENNTWDLVKLEEVCRKFSFDIDGQGAGGIGDSFGIAAEGTTSFAATVFGAGFKLSDNDGETITLIGATKAMDDIINAAGKTWFDKTVVCTPESIATSSDYEAPTDVFCDNRALFFCSFPSAFDTGLNEKCHFEFGVMPFAKYDATSQTRYYNWANIENNSIFAVPYTVADPAQVGFFLQAISEEACTTSYDAYIESKCKVQDSYDELTAKYLDIVFQSVTYDVVACLNCGGLYSMIKSDIPSVRLNLFVKLYAAKEKVATNALEQYIATFESN